MFFTGSTTTTAGSAVFSRNIETIIDRLEVEINGQLISTGCSMINQLYQILYDLQCGTDARNRRCVLQNANDISAAPTANQTNVPFMIQNWLGFISSAAPNHINTGILGNVRIRLTMASPSVLVQSSTATGAAFKLDNITFAIDCIDIADEMFHRIHNEFLARGGTYTIPFNNYYSFSSTGTSLSQTTKFSVSTQSLNRLWGCFIPQKFGVTTYAGSAAGGSTWDPIAKGSTYFSRVAEGTIVNSDATTNVYALQDYQFGVNGILFPNAKFDANQAFGNLMNSLMISQNTDGGCHPLINSLAAWKSSFWVSEVRFDHGSDGTTLISGIDTRGNVSQGFWQTQQASNGSISANVMALVFAQTTSTLLVNSGRQLQLVL
jgi:hypothetical protein